VQSLDICIACGKGVMTIQHSRRIRATPWLKRYLKCDVCGQTDSEICEAGPPRRQRNSRSNMEPTAGDKTTPRGILAGTETFTPRRVTNSY